MPKLNVLVIATQRTPTAARIAMALADVGFRVAALTPYGHVVRTTRTIRVHFSYRSRSGLKSILRAIDLWHPDLLVCNDDRAVWELQKLHRRTSASDAPSMRRVSELIELSLGPAGSFPAIGDKSAFSAQVEIEGLRFPATSVFPSSAASKFLEGPFKSVFAKLIYPVVIKADRSFGGKCVRVVHNDMEARAALWELQTPLMWRRELRRVFGTIFGRKTFDPLMPLRRTISLQRYIPGRPANRAVICWKGKVLAGLSVEVVEEQLKHGPASVVRLIDHAEMMTGAARMVKRLDLSGFVGFDFVLDSSDQAWIIEMNPRVTPISHFALLDGTDLAGSLYAHMTGLRPLPRPPTNNRDRDVIALFPNSVALDPSSEHSLSSQHDVPWNEPELVRRCLDKTVGTRTRRRFRTAFQILSDMAASSPGKFSGTAGPNRFGPEPTDVE
jgi:hypothetical protein